MLNQYKNDFEKEMEIYRRVKTAVLEDINVGTTADPRLLSIAKELSPNTKI